MDLTPRRIHRFPPVTSHTLAGWAFHPVPVALGEVSYLAQVEQATVTRDLEGVGLSSGVAVRRGIATHPVSPPPLTEHLPPAGSDDPSAIGRFTRCRAKPPRWELLRPAVVIRRRPQRD